MDSELKNFIKVWILAILSISYCYFISKQLPKGIPRLFSLLPIFSLFILLPLPLSSSLLGGTTAFYLVWLANFKLLLFAFNQGPLSDPSQTPKTFLHFLSISLLPIKIKSEPAKKSSKLRESAVVALKVLLLAVVLRAYDYIGLLPQYSIWGLYSCHVYLGVELVLAISSVPVRAVLGLALEPQFDEPYLATSLQDFWGHRWNLMVTSSLRPTVYLPTRNLSSRILSRKWAPLPAIFATFLVSGLMHEVMYFYLTRVGPTWEVTWFFVIQGLATAAELAVKKVAAGRWRLSVTVLRPFTLGFVVVTSVWLFFPQLVRNGVDQKIIRENYILVDFVRARLSI